MLTDFTLAYCAIHMVIALKQGWAIIVAWGSL